MKIKLLLGLVLGLGIANTSESITVNNDTTHPVYVGYAFTGCAVAPGTRTAFIEGGGYFAETATCHLSWLNVFIDSAGIATKEATHAPDVRWKQVYSRSFKSKWNAIGMAPPQTIDIYYGAANKETGIKPLVVKVY